MPLTLSDHGSCWNLLCGEDVSELADDSPGGAGEPAEFPDDSDESIAGFIEGEADSSPRFDYPDRFQSKSLDPAARQEAVTWILKVSSPAAGDCLDRLLVFRLQVHEYYCFRPLTACLAVNYLDRFLSRHCLPEGIAGCYRSMKQVVVDRTRRGSTSVDLEPTVSSSYSSPPSKRRKLNNNCLWVDDDQESS
ncbi:hypothetical protein B296_00026268 [Ensete ventricosum]|uniref:Cyclin N-terminal domain-containing protein n=1 Tax=Ensete ventricosum TaxID=4639 RepID=A0A426YRN2_ENSVE|nr:hypothetical protein B296_00026268 [Ensete ventricosum]